MTENEKNVFNDRKYRLFLSSGGNSTGYLSLSDADQSTLPCDVICEPRTSLLDWANVAPITAHLFPWMGYEKLCIRIEEGSQVNTYFFFQSEI